MPGSLMGYVWAEWAWVITGQLCLGPLWVMCGLSGHGLELVTHVWVPYGLSGHGIELVNYVWVPYGLFVG